jgi:CoA:oxalate CoA-transferase
MTSRERIIAVIEHRQPGRVPADYWCAEVLSWQQLFQHAAFAELDWVMEVQREDGPKMKTTRCPITVDGARLKSLLGAPRVGQHTEKIAKEFSLT